MPDTRRDTIITSESASRMLSRVSPIYDNSYVGLWMFEAIGRSYDELWYIANTLPDQLFPESATWAIELWEQRYGITPTESQTLEERRQKIVAARSVPKPFTPSSLQQYIRNLCGRESEILEHVDDYTFAVYVTGNGGLTESDYHILRNFIDRHKPSHLSYDLNFQSGCEITIGIETEYWKFPYPFSGVDPAGTIPLQSLVGAVDRTSIRASPDAEGYTINYTPCGVMNSGTGVL